MMMMMKGMKVFPTKIHMVLFYLNTILRELSRT